MRVEEKRRCVGRPGWNIEINLHALLSHGERLNYVCRRDVIWIRRSLFFCVFLLIKLTRISISELKVSTHGKIDETCFHWFFSPNATTCLLRLRGPLRLWLKCNRLLRLGRPVGAVTLSRWEWWWSERWIWGARGGLKPNFYQIPRPKTHMVERGIAPATSWLVVRNSDHQATRLVASIDVGILKQISVQKGIYNAQYR